MCGTDFFLLLFLLLLISLATSTRMIDLIRFLLCKLYFVQYKNLSFFLTEPGRGKITASCTTYAVVVERTHLLYDKMILLIVVEVERATNFKFNLGIKALQ